MEYSFVPFHQIANEFIPKHKKYFSDINHQTDDYVLDVDWNYYIQLSLAGHLFAAIMGNQDGLQGHIILSVTNHPRHKNILIASAESTHVEKKFRGPEAKALEAFAISHLRLMGVREVSFTWSDERQGEWLNKLGYEPTHTVWVKKIGEFNNGK